MNEPIIPGESKEWESIDVYLFENGQQYTPPRKFHLRSEELNWWEATLGYLARSLFGSMHPSVDLYTMTGKKVNSPMELHNGIAYVAVLPPDQFIDTGYENYLIKASRSWEKRQSRKTGLQEDNQEPEVKQITDGTGQTDVTEDEMNIQIPDKTVGHVDLVQNTHELLTVPPNYIVNALETKQKNNIDNIIKPTDKRRPNTRLPSPRAKVVKKINTNPLSLKPVRKANSPVKTLPTIKRAPINVNDVNSLQASKKAPVFPKKLPPLPTKKVLINSNLTASSLINTKTLGKLEVSPTRRTKTTPINATEKWNSEVGINKTPIVKSKVPFKTIKTIPTDLVVPSLKPKPLLAYSEIGLANVSNRDINEKSNRNKDTFTGASINKNYNIPLTYLDAESMSGEKDINTRNTISNINNTEESTKGNNVTKRSDQNHTNVKSTVTSHDLTFHRVSDESNLKENNKSNELSQDDTDLKMLTDAILEMPLKDYESLQYNSKKKLSAATAAELAELDSKVISTKNVNQKCTEDLLEMSFSRIPDQKHNKFKTSEVKLEEPGNTNDLRYNNTNLKLMEEQQHMPLISCEGERTQLSETQKLVPLRKNSILLVKESELQMKNLEPSKKEHKPESVEISLKQHFVCDKPLVTLVNKGDVVNMRLNIEIRDGDINTVLSSNTPNYTSNVNSERNDNINETLVQDKTLHSNPDDVPHLCCQRKQQVVLVQCACCDLTANNYDKTYVIVLPIIANPAKLRCDRNEKEAQNESVFTIKTTTSNKEQIDIAPPPSESGEAINTAPVSRESLSSRCGKDFEKAGASKQVSIYDAKDMTGHVVNGIALQSQSQSSVQLSEHSKRTKNCEDRSAQTDWRNVLLEVRMQEDGHYTFHLPSLSVLRQFKVPPF